jgi:hypothetical protein
MEEGNLARNFGTIGTTGTTVVPATGLPIQSGSARLGFAVCPSYGGPAVLTQPGNLESSNYRANTGVFNGPGWTDTVSGTSGPGPLSFLRQMGFRDMVDGSSKTIMVSESRQPGPWIYGSLWHHAATAPGTLNAAGVWPTSNNAALGAGCRILLMSGTFNYTNLPTQQPHLSVVGSQAIPASSAPYTQIGHYWGPSSDHSGKLIGNVFGDGHVEFISADVDPNIYNVLCTRGNGEPVPQY